MRIFRGKTIILLIATVVLCSFAIQRFTAYVLHIDGFSFAIDKSISASHANDIITFVHNNKHMQGFSLPQIIVCLQKQFPVIEDIKTFRSADGILKVSVSSVKPTFVINKDYVISPDGMLLTKDLFSAEGTALCPAIEIKGLQCKDVVSHKKVPESFAVMLKKLPHRCFDTYDVVWERETKSWLLDKHNGKFAIIFNDECVPNNMLLSACSKLKTELKSKGYFSCRRMERWIADVRFKDQIVLFKALGGGDG